ncbi:PilT/PilU family type 4a pilus ATPase [Psychromonas sp. KJ10-2]|uniref:PilT/PilU family type 4a pilus ATPase n=1 Tax=Psychromonas sp. KJ10-2 TaxID=3391822 RepID=UPI0039B4912D
MLDKLLGSLDQLKASDLYISAGLPPTVKLNGRLSSLSDDNMAPEDIYNLLALTMDEHDFAQFKSQKEANFAIHIEGLGRFRISAFMQKSSPGMVVRRINDRIPTSDELYLPDQLKEICMAKSGLVLFVGPTGSGKSTTLAAMVGFRNQHASGHILTIEDPIEFVHEHARSVVTQREVGLDTDSIEEALRNATRQAPDVIVQGEIRSTVSMSHAISHAQTGYLSMATINANSAEKALEQMLHYMPEERHNQFLNELAVNLKAIVAQRLIPTLDEQGSVAAFEVMVNSPALSNAIRKGERHLLKDIMKSSKQAGMQTLDQALFKLYSDSKISYSEALAHADSANDLRLMIKLKVGSSSKLASDSLNEFTID